MKEVWRDVIGFEGLYQASNLGRIRSLDRQVRSGNRYNKNIGVAVKRGKVLKQVDIGLGYLQVCLRKNNKNYSRYVALLVWEAFNGPIPKGMQVNHINEDKSDNRLENLNLMTPKENCNWGTRNERVLKTKSTRTYSKPSYFSRKVFMYSLEGEFEKEFNSITEAAKYLGRYYGSSSNISSVCQGKLKTAYGHLWKYAL